MTKLPQTLRCADDVTVSGFEPRPRRRNHRRRRGRLRATGCHDQPGNLRRQALITNDPIESDGFATQGPHGQCCYRAAPSSPETAVLDARLATDVGNGAVFECGFGTAGDGVPVAGGIAKRARWAAVRVPRPKYLARNGMGAGMGRPVNTSMLKLVESAAIWCCALTRGRFPEPTAGAAGVLILLKNRALNNEISCCRADSAGGDGTRHVGGVAGRRPRTACDQNNSGENDE